MALSITSIALALTVKVAEETLQQHMAATPSVISSELLAQVLAYEQQQQLGYYPALDYFIQHNAIEPDLVEALKNISWLVTKRVRNEIKLKLRPAFSTIKFEAIQAIAYTMPNIRGNDANKHEKLLEHYNLSRVKVNLITTLIQKTTDRKMTQSFAKNVTHRWLKGSFENIIVNRSTVLD